MEKTDLLLGLVHCTFLSCAEKAFLAKNLDNLESLTVLSIEDICIKVGRKIQTRIWNPENLHQLVCNDVQMMQRFDIRYVSVLSPDYPPVLREIHDPPFAVFWRGLLPDPERPLVGIVGTRSPSGDGALASYRLGKEFAEAGISVISGLARGIDAFAHKGNVESGGASVAVLACGLDRIYPRSNVRLASRLVNEGGCLMGEYPPGDSPLQYRFPQRNRIISGLARAVIVVEAPSKSGALITADFALEQGRDLFVCRDTLDSSRGEGTARLHEDGAVAITSANEILASWGYRCTRDFNTCFQGDSGLSRSTMTGRQLAFDFRKEIFPRENGDY